MLHRSSPHTPRRKDGLLSHASDTNSQCGEDGILSFVFTSVLPPPPNGGRRWLAEIGSWDGRHLSNSYGLLNGRDGGWNGVLVEADGERSAKAEEMYAGMEDSSVGRSVLCVNRAVGLEGESGINGVLAAAVAGRPTDDFPPDSFDFLSIDVDSFDYHILSDVITSDTFSPKLVCVEYNPTIPLHISYIQARDITVRQGSSARAIVTLAEANGYRLVETTLYNLLLVRSDLFPLFAPHLPVRDVVVKSPDGTKTVREEPADSLEELCSLSMTTDLFQLYDGTLKYAGCKKLLWHRVRFDEERLQMIEAGERRFPFGLAGGEGGGSG